MATPIVSVAMCSFDMAAYIDQQLASIARQTRLPDELVICDDGSQDRTVEIIEAFAATAPFAVRVVRNERHLGCTGNFEQAISLCRGDVIFLSDHDDVWHERKIELILALMQDQAVGAAFGDAAVVEADLQPKGFTVWDTCNFTSARRARFAEGEQFAELIVNNVMQGAAAAFRSSLRPAILPLPQEWPHDYWIALIAAAGMRIAFTECTVLDYRQHGRNLIGAGQPHRPEPPATGFRRIGRTLGRWVRIARAPSDFYASALADAERDLRALSVLRERLSRISESAAAIAVVDRDIAGLTHQRDGLRRTLRWWRWAAPRRSSGARDQHRGP